MRTTLAIAMLALPALAQAQRPWAQEPTSFMSAQFGVRLLDQFQECPKRTFEGTLGPHYEFTTGVRCFEYLDLRKSMAKLRGEPEIGVRVLGGLYLTLANEVIEGAGIRVYRPDWLKLLDLMSARYGPAHAEETATFTNRAGARYIGAVKYWRGSNVTIKLSEYGDRLDESGVEVYTSSLIESRLQRSRENAEKFKDRL